MSADWLGEVRRLDTLPDTLAQIVDALRDAVINGTGMTAVYYDEQGIHAQPIDWRSTVVGIEQHDRTTMHPMMARDFTDGA